MKKVNKAILYCLLWQISFVLPVFLGLLFLNLVFAYSFVLGASIFIVSNLYFTVYASRASGVQQLSGTLKSFMQGEFGKLALSALGFVVVFSFFKSLAATAVFAGFISMIMLQCIIASLLISGKLRH